jgi:hypothetical protein
MFGIQLKWRQNMGVAISLFVLYVVGEAVVRMVEKDI